MAFLRTAGPQLQLLAGNLEALLMVERQEEKDLVDAAQELVAVEVAVQDRHDDVVHKLTRYRYA